LPHEVGDHVIAALAWQEQVEEDDIGLKPMCHRERLLRRRSFTGDADVSLSFQAAAHARPQEFVVIDDQDTDHAARLSSSVARVPPVGRDASPNSPPWRAAMRPLRLRPRPLPAV
jgi:hypothetical protein